MDTKPVGIQSLLNIEHLNKNLLHHWREVKQDEGSDNQTRPR